MSPSTDLISLTDECAQIIAQSNDFEIHECRQFPHLRQFASGELWEAWDIEKWKVRKLTAGLGRDLGRLLLPHANR